MVGYEPRHLTIPPSPFIFAQPTAAADKGEADFERRFLQSGRRNHHI